MIPIVKSLAASDESLNIYEIQRVSRSCFSDTNEVTQMLSFLTSFGKVSETSEGWIKENKSDQKPSKPRRFYYLKDIYSILSELSEEKPLECGNLAEKIHIEAKLVLEYLEFLSIITNIGTVRKEGNNYPLSYRIRQY